MADDKPSPQELQARQELENAERLGNEESARAARKRLEALGGQIEESADAPSVARKSTPPQGRRAPGKQTG